MVQALILGSLFYMIPQNTNGLFTKAGYVMVRSAVFGLVLTRSCHHSILFLILLVNSLLGLGEVVSSFKGRSILAKHKSLALYRPTALILAQVMVDIPVVAGQVVSCACEFASRIWRANSFGCAKDRLPAADLLYESTEADRWSVFHSLDLDIRHYARSVWAIQAYRLQVCLAVGRPWRP